MGLAWESVRWRDGSVYEGTAVDGKAQGRGTLRYANGDKYEGQFASNYQHGFGAYVWKDGTVYRGQWALGEMRGCGVRISKGHGGGFDVEEGYFHNGDHVGELWGCSVRAAR
ncbi:unnamed protein product [Pedinophyceae sp. YPF-701]|nr:unnamed protein product [Pedinophyceae sp. YPF-701]